MSIAGDRDRSITSTHTYADTLLRHCLFQMNAPVVIAAAAAVAVVAPAVADVVPASSSIIYPSDRFIDQSAIVNLTCDMNCGNVVSDPLLLQCRKMRRRDEDQRAPRQRDVINQRVMWKHSSLIHYHYFSYLTCLHEQGTSTVTHVSIGFNGRREHVRIAVSVQLDVSLRDTMTIASQSPIAYP